MNLRKLYLSYLKLDEVQRLNKARKELAEITNYLKLRMFSEDDILGFEISLFKLFVSANKKASIEEHSMFNQIFIIDTSYEQFFEICNNGADEKFVNDMNDVIDSWPDQVKFACVGLGLCIMTNDGKLDEPETKLLEKILA